MNNLLVNYIFILLTLVLQPINAFASSEILASKEYTIEKLDTCIRSFDYQRIVDLVGSKNAVEIPLEVRKKLCINSFRRDDMILKTMKGIKSRELARLTFKAEQGGAEDQYELASDYSSYSSLKSATHYVPLDIRQKKAAEWYRKSAEQGYAKAQYRLGHIYSRGWGIAENKQEAEKWYRKSAEQGYAKAQYTLGYSYSQGEGVAEDKDEGEKWYRLAAQQGHQGAKVEIEKKQFRTLLFLYFAWPTLFMCIYYIFFWRKFLQQFILPNFVGVLFQVYIYYFIICFFPYPWLISGTISSITLTAVICSMVSSTVVLILFLRDVNSYLDSRVRRYLENLENIPFKQEIFSEQVGKYNALETRYKLDMFNYQVQRDLDFDPLKPEEEDKYIKMIALSVFEDATSSSGVFLNLMIMFLISGIILYIIP